MNDASLPATVTHLDMPQRTLLPALSETTAVISMIERVARDPSVDIDKLERLFALQERMILQRAKFEYSSALSLLYPELPVITERGKIEVRAKDAKGERNGPIQQSTSYALWEDINEAIKPALANHGFALSFRCGLTEDGRIKVTGILSHAGGHQEETTIILPHDSTGSKNAVQAIGSSTSYGKRYTASALLNITSRGEDDDGNGVGVGPKTLSKPHVVPRVHAEKAEAWALRFVAEIDTCADAEELVAWQRLNLDTIEIVKKVSNTGRPVYATIEAAIARATDRIAKAGKGTVQATNARLWDEKEGCFTTAPASIQQEFGLGAPKATAKPGITITDAEGFIRSALALFKSVKTGEELERVFERDIRPHWDGLFPSDQSEILGAYRRRENELAP